MYSVDTQTTRKHSIPRRGALRHAQKLCQARDGRLFQVFVVEVIVKVCGWRGTESVGGMTSKDESQVPMGRARTVEEVRVDFFGQRLVFQRQAVLDVNVHCAGRQTWLGRRTWAVLSSRQLTVSGIECGHRHIHGSGQSPHNRDRRCAVAAHRDTSLCFREAAHDQQRHALHPRCVCRLVLEFLHVHELLFMVHAEALHCAPAGRYNKCPLRRGLLQQHPQSWLPA